MRWSTPWRVLVGDRAAILEAAGSRWTLLVGAILVLSASLARKYDTVDLLAEPHELLHGFAATLVNAFVLHLLIWMAPCDPRPAFWRSYASFLGVFWLAAPMGWVYGVPYERLFSAQDAVSANLWSLAVVSLVRVVWVTRVLNVLWGVPGLKRGVFTFFIVMVYSDAVAIVALLTVPLPTLDVMGGLQQPPEVREVASAAFMAGAAAVLSAPIWLVGGISVLASGGRGWVGVESGAGRAPRAAIATAVLTALAWGAFLPWMQPPVRRRTQVETALRSGRYEDAAAALCRHARLDFPPVWNPPPRVEWGGREDEGVSLAALAVALESRGDVPDWVVEVYAPKMVRRASRALGLYWDNVLGEERWGREVRQDPASGWKMMEAGDRADVLVLLEFVLRRAKGLSPSARANLRAWVEAGKVQNDGGAG